ncbi:translocation/assembly module TamB domain-containing protein [Pseudodonghicola xiamenensis]|uniref:Translocation/assembly module TamB n=1 Tax=Pseudodonghicola xiamenensis TaxID=337702 RepID=A0A8J3H9U6_9RHOB|nr:translocation/assembly module TamB domain-containing protein [Pseudodonghicola xiamenensis]GHG93579.1 translocation/assembly module TamB [Pseudodonghicola xiamenensis]
MKRYLVLVTCVTLTVSAPGLAPAKSAPKDASESGGMLVRFLENSLSGDNRKITVVGLDGALSSRATIKELKVSDDDGVWLTIHNAVLDWNRLALVRGRFSVNALTADEIIIARKPIPSPSAVDLPSPEATPFSLPDLPVSIELAKIGVQKLDLGADLMGMAAELKVDGSLSLADGALDTDLGVTRLDRPGDQIGLKASFANDTRQIGLDLKLIEDQGGLVSTLLNMPDRPPLLLTAKGDGPVSDFTADIALVTDDTERLGGQVRLKGLETPVDADPTAPVPIGFSADLAGDVSPMLPADYRSFFGTDTALMLRGESHPDGQLDITALDLHSAALALTGDMALAASGQIERLKFQGGITPPSGQEVVLPISGDRTTLGAARFDLSFDASTGNDWDLVLAAETLTRPEMSLHRAALVGNGTLDQSQGFAIEGDIEAALSGLSLADAAQQRAIGDEITLKGAIARDAGGAFEFNGFKLTGSDYTATLDGRVAIPESGLEVDTKLHLGAADLSRFSGLAGQDLGGSVTADFTGKGAPLDGTFDFTLDMQAQDLAAGIDQVDPLIAGATTLQLSAARGLDGLTIRNFDLKGQALSASASGTAKTADSALRFTAALDDLARVMPQVKGPLTLKGNLKQTGTTWSGDVNLKGPNKTFADLNGSFDPTGEADLTFNAALDRLERFVPQLSGQLTAKGRAQSKGGIWHGDVALNGPDSSQAKLSGSFDPAGDADLTFDATLDRLERFMPELTGRLAAKGTAQRKNGLWTLDANAAGPSDITTRVSGTYDEAQGTANMDATGRLRLEGANPFLRPNSISGAANFDMKLRGAPSLAALSGTITTSGGRMAIPSAAQTLDNIAGTVTLANSRANVAISTNLGAGGTIRVNGPVALEPPFDGRITVDLLNLILTDNKSITSSANGQLVLAGALTAGPQLSGRVQFGETNINLNAVSGSAAAAAIPEGIVHIDESAAGRATRDRAGLIQTESSGSSGPAIGLDIALLAPNKVFARGFGLQAELGGAMQIRGTTAAVEPTGQISLIRGTLDLLGRRLKLTKGIVSLQGDLQPYVEFESSTTTEDGKATIQIAGPIDGPKISVFSDPDRPAEEALAMLVFGSRISDLSPFMIAKMAASLATLGRSGGVTDDLRNATGVSALDIGMDADGAGQVGAGAYLSDNIYTDFTINTKGETEVNLNFDLTKSLTVKGSMDNLGNTGVGLFYERDY